VVGGSRGLVRRVELKSVRMTHWEVDPMSVVGEIGGSYDNNPGIAPGIPDLNASFYNFMGGPRIASHRNRALTPFAQVLVGDVRVGNNLGG
jgi:hypothetical protein